MGLLTFISISVLIAINIYRVFYIKKMSLYTQLIFTAIGVISAACLYISVYVLYEALIAGYVVFYNKKNEKQIKH